MTTDKGILIRNIYYMLSYAFQELRRDNYKNIAAEMDFEDIYDLFAEILANGISYQLKQGLHKEYVLHSDKLTTLRGRLNFGETVKLKVRQQQRLACEYDEFSENNLFNQILKSTIVILKRCDEVKKNRKNKLNRLLLFFSEVDIIDLRSVKWSTLKFDRNSRTYQMLLYICYFVMDGLLLTTEDGKYRMREFSDTNMNRLFEKFVLEYYRKHHPLLKASASMVDWNIKSYELSGDILPNMRTDITLNIGDRTLIIDTKYYGQTMQEYFNKKTIHSNNYYQVFTYVMNKDKGHKGNVDGMLLYAKTQELDVLDGMVEYDDGNKFYFKTLDLNQDFKDICKQLDGFVDRG